LEVDMVSVVIGRRGQFDPNLVIGAWKRLYGA